MLKHEFKKPSSLVNLFEDAFYKINKKNVCTIKKFNVL